MHQFFKTAAMAAVFAAAAFASAHAGTIIGTTDTDPNHSNSAPFGSLQAGYFYQQVYDDGAFSAPLTISQLTFYDTVNKTAGSLVPGDFQIYLTATSQQVGAILDNFPSTLLSGATLVFDGALPALADDRLDFVLSHTFAYNPGTDGNLLLIVKSFNFSVGAPLYLDSDTSGTVTTSRHYSGPNGPAGNLRTGLITGFNDVTGVPEPATWTMLILGLGMIGWTLRSSRRRASVA